MISVTSETTVKTIKSAEDLMGDLQAIAQYQVLVGVPEEKDTRKSSKMTPEEWKMKQIRKKLKIKEPKSSPGNAMLAYVHDRGSDLQNIPARPFMKPGIALAQNRINTYFRLAAKAGIEGNFEEVKKNLHRAGLAGQNGIRNIIRIGLNFEPLKRATLLRRTRMIDGKISPGRLRMWHGDKGKREELMAAMQPLQDTGQLRNSITYVVVDGNSGSRQVGPVKDETE